MRWAKRFKESIDYYKSIRNYLMYFGVYEEDPTNSKQGCLVFDFGLVLEN